MTCIDPMCRSASISLRSIRRRLRLFRYAQYGFAAALLPATIRAALLAMLTKQKTYQYASIPPSIKIASNLLSLK